MSPEAKMMYKIIKTKVENEGECVFTFKNRNTAKQMIAHFNVLAAHDKWNMKYKDIGSPLFNKHQVSYSFTTTD